jgi:hypothetical protein
MPKYTALIAEDVPHYTAVDIDAADLPAAIEKARSFDLGTLPSDPDWNSASARRIVEMTDENDNLVPNFLPLNL